MHTNTTNYKLQITYCTLNLYQNTRNFIITTNSILRSVIIMKNVVIESGGFSALLKKEGSLTWTRKDIRNFIVLAVRWPTQF